MVGLNVFLLQTIPVYLPIKLTSTVSPVYLNTFPQHNLRIVCTAVTEHVHEYLTKCPLTVLKTSYTFSLTINLMKSMVYKQALTHGKFILTFKLFQFKSFCNKNYKFFINAIFKLILKICR